MLPVSSLLQSALSHTDRLDAELLIGHILRKSREFVVAHPEHRIGKWDEWKIRRLCQKRAEGVPLAYLIGHKEFYGLDFFVNRHTLIPRPETEALVDAVAGELNASASHESIIYTDVGAGSGCVAISVAKHVLASAWLNKTGDYGILQIYATDISSAALSVAKKNAKRHGARVDFLRGDLLDPLFRNCFFCMGSAKLVVSANLPYLTEAQYSNSPMPEIHHEPKSALVAEDGGLALYKQLLQQIRDANISSISCFFEIDPGQSVPLSAYVRQLFPNAAVEIKKDLAGGDRIIAFNTPGSLADSPPQSKFSRASAGCRFRLPRSIWFSLQYSLFPMCRQWRCRLGI